MLDLDRKYLAIVKKILQEHIPNTTVWAYGSRIKGTAHEGSDLDLAIINNDVSISSNQLSALRAAFSESDLPILVDILNWDDIPANFKDEIEKRHIVLQEPQ